jgi:LemA protein
MKITRVFSLFVLLTALGLSLTGCGPYNKLVALEEAAESSWSQVENVYQRRADLIPNLVETVKGAADFEQETLTAVVEARSKVSQIQIDGAPSVDQLAQFQGAQDALSSALSRLLVVVERYPELTATQAFRDLQAQLEGTENRIAVERRRFNEAVRSYNTARRQFPTALYARAFDFGEKAYFAASPGAEEPPRVDFGN